MDLRFWRRKKSPQPAPSPDVADLGSDPLDPHGDGTLRPGDPLFDSLFDGGGAMLAERRDDGQWNVQRFGDNDG